MGNENDVLDGLIQRVDAGTIAGPRITRSGFIEGKSPFSSQTGELVETKEEALGQVRWYAARGYHQVKLYNSMTPEWAPDLVEEAHRLGLDRKSVVKGKSVSVRVDLGGRRLINKKKP